MASASPASSRAAPRGRARAPASWSRRTVACRSMSARPRSGRGSRPSWRRSPPMRSSCRSSAFASITARPPICAEGFGSYGSRSTVMGGCAIVLAAEALIAKFRAAAAARLGVPAAELSVTGGVARAPTDAASSWAKPSTARCAPREPSPTRNPTYTYGTAIAHVAVDPKTGQVEVVDYVVVDDVGRDHQSAHPARPGDRRRRAGARQRVHRGDRL